MHGVREKIVRIIRGIFLILQQREHGHYLVVTSPVGGKRKRHSDGEIFNEAVQCGSHVIMKLYIGLTFERKDLWCLQFP